MNLKALSLAIGIFTASTTTSFSQVVFIDFGLTDFQTAGNWNNFAGSDSFRFQDLNTPSALLTDMIDSTGANTGIDLVYTAMNSSADSAGIGGADFNVPTTTGFPLSATRDTMFLTGGGARLTMELQGLAPNAEYDLTMFAAIGATRDDTLWTVDGETLSLNPSNNTTNTVTFSNVQADNLGVISIAWLTDTEIANPTAAHWNTLSITAVPEPSSIALAITAGMGLMLLRRCQRRASEIV